MTLISSCIPWKHQNNSWFSGVFRGYRKRSVAWNKLSGWDFTGCYSEEHTNVQSFHNSIQPTLNLSDRSKQFPFCEKLFLRLYEWISPRPVSSTKNTNRLFHCSANKRLKSTNKTGYKYVKPLSVLKSPKLKPLSKN